MMKAGSETGSMTNYLMSSGSGITPEVGMGATILKWTDRQACTIIAIKGRKLTVQYDKATRTDGNGMSESQQYSYTPDPEGATRDFTLTKSGWRESGSKGKGSSLLIGHRKHYHDYSF